MAGEAAALHLRGSVLLGGAVAATVVLLWLLLPPQPYWMIDLDVYRAGATAVRAGTPLYEVSVDNAIVRGSRFTYPPAAALTFLPLAWTSAGGAALAFLVLDTLALAAASWLLLGMAGVRARLRWTLMLVPAAHLALPVLANTGVGQINTVLMLAVIVDLAGVLPPRWRGLLIGAAAAIKLVPLIFVAYLLATGRVAGAARAGAALLAVTGVAFILLPNDSQQYWLDGIATQASRVGVLNQVGNQSLAGAIARTGLLSGTGTWWIPVTLLTAVAGVTLAGWAYWCGDELAGMVIAAFTGILAVPFAWPHHAVWIVAVLVWLGSRMAWPVAPRRRLAALIGVLAVQWTLFAFIAERWEFAREFDAGQQVLLLICGVTGTACAAILSAPWWLRRSLRWREIPSITK